MTCARPPTPSPPSSASQHDAPRPPSAPAADHRQRLFRPRCPVRPWRPVRPRRPARFRRPAALRRPSALELRPWRPPPRRPARRRGPGRRSDAPPTLDALPATGTTFNSDATPAPDAPFAPDALRQLVREVLREVLPALADQPSRRCAFQTGQNPLKVTSTGCRCGWAAMRTCTRSWSRCCGWPATRNGVSTCWPGGSASPWLG